MQPAAAARAKSKRSKKCTERMQNTFSSIHWTFSLGCLWMVRCSGMDAVLDTAAQAEALPGFELTHTSAAATVHAAESNLYAYMKY